MVTPKKTAKKSIEIKDRTVYVVSRRDFFVWKAFAVYQTRDTAKAFLASMPSNLRSKYKIESVWLND